MLYSAVTVITPTYATGIFTSSIEPDFPAAATASHSPFPVIIAVPFALT